MSVYRSMSSPSKVQPSHAAMPECHWLEEIRFVSRTPATGVAGMGAETLVLALCIGCRHYSRLRRLDCETIGFSTARLGPARATCTHPHKERAFPNTARRARVFSAACGTAENSDAIWPNLCSRPAHNPSHPHA